jgi:hypothetical protein
MVNLFRDLQSVRIAVGNALPPDAEIRAVAYDIASDCWRLAVRSEAYPVVPLGEVIPDVEGIVLDTEHVAVAAVQ